MFGTTVKPLKQFIIQNDIMGPCWLQIKNWDHVMKKVSYVQERNKNIKIKKSIVIQQSWCATEATLHPHGQCLVIKDETGKPLLDGPPLNVMSLSLEFRMNYDTKQNEILAISGFSCANGNFFFYHLLFILYTDVIVQWI